MNWDTEIWAPCRLGEAFTLREFQKEHTEYLYSIKADWMGHHGDACCVRFLQQLEEKYPHNVRMGAGPRPWGCCWTYEAKIKITPPVWCWDMQVDTMFGLDLKPKRNGNRRKAKLDCVMIHQGRPVYRMIIETSDGDSHRYYDSIPVLDPYFAPIWPAVGDNNATTEKSARDLADDLVTAAVHALESAIINGTDYADPTGIVAAAAADPVAAPVTEPAEAEQTPEEPEQTTTSKNTATVANYAPGGIIPESIELEVAPGELVTPLAQPSRILTTSNTEEFVTRFMGWWQLEGLEDQTPNWTGTENKPPGACIGGRLPFSGKHYYYVWFDEPHTEGDKANE